MKQYLLIILSFFCCIHLSFAKSTIPDNPFGEGVHIFTPNMSSKEINETIHKIYHKQRYNEFGHQRYALLFMPGEYGKSGEEDIDVRVAFYMQILGMGKSPDDVTIKGAVRTQDESYGALTNFWRGAENLSVVPTLGAIDDNSIPKDQNVWAVSQASPLRRFHVKKGSLRLYQTGYASGGFLADSVVDGTIYSGTQQQWLTRNTRFKNWNGSNWNIVFSGVFGEIPTGTWPTPPYTVIEKSPLIREKPFLHYDEKSKEFIVSTRTLRANVAGTDWHIVGTPLPLSKFYIVKHGDSALDINEKLDKGKHLFFPPGVYHVSDPIHIKNANTVIFGLGFPTLVSDSHHPAMIIDDVDGVQLAGVMFDAGDRIQETMLLVGKKEKTNVSHRQNPISLYDLFCRVGGPGYSYATDTCFTINSNDVIADDVWTWRADHVADDGHLGWNVNKADTGVKVHGDDVIIYNLMAEHFQKYQVIWKGENGRVIHYQSEMPYDVPDQSKWKNDNGKDGWASYKVGDNVKKHHVTALGIYTYFRDSPDWSTSAIEAPPDKHICIQHTILFWLNGVAHSGIKHVVDEHGPGVNQTDRKAEYAVWPLGKC